MSQLLSTNSTELREIYSVGRFENDCETPYSLSLWPDDRDEDEWTLLVECMPGQVFVFHGDELRAPGFISMEDKISFAMRRVCHFFVDQIDSNGLEEVCRSLAEFYAYYRPTEHVPQLTDVRKKHAVVSNRSTSPAFLIGEE